ncbi:hypothetical protein K470DRAFT_254389 [Piedraia hortae CBS 480.64]|uniref:Uncharacterized protein n=1 Tax=Piedraia hortae CBS 480.64 TaxID=1314780 RepID=A0A6A7CC31_9PEZI|nr:hypothetical protein K470DRAFT_254389 [Piedraia hortae CBS 480.64]
MALPYRRLPLRSSQRLFSTTCWRKAELTAILTTPPVALLDALHSSGLSWTYAIPASALIIRSIIALCFRRSQFTDPAANAVLLPLAYARSLGRYGSDMKTRTRGMGIIAKIAPRLHYSWTMYREMRQLKKDLGIRVGGIRPFAEFGGLVIMTEGIRAKFGAREGLLGLVLAPIRGAWEIILMPLKGWRGEAAQEGTEETAAGLIDPSIHVEGPSWCADLAVADPTLAVPTALFSVMLLNTFVGASGFIAELARGTSAAGAPPATNVSPVNRTGSKVVHKNLGQSKAVFFDRLLEAVNGISLTNASRLSLTVKFLFFIGSIHIPVAILLYILANSTLSLFLRGRTQVTKTAMRPITPCRRPLRYRVRRNP